LIEAINAYPGAVILVSHDRYLIDACADRLWLVADGKVAPFEGDLDEYRSLVLADRGGSKSTEPRPGGAGPGRGRAEIRRAAAEKRAELTPLRRRIAEADAAVKRYGEEIARIDQTLAQPGFFARDPAQAASLAKARAVAAAALARAEDDWLEASANYEQAMAE
jgi:ATP-binding cassette subfamily F protein 3